MRRRRVRQRVGRAELALEPRGQGEQPRGAPAAAELGALEARRPLRRRPLLRAARTHTRRRRRCGLRPRGAVVAAQGRGAQRAAEKGAEGAAAGRAVRRRAAVRRRRRVGAGGEDESAGGGEEGEGGQEGSDADGVGIIGDDRVKGEGRRRERRRRCREHLVRRAEEEG